MLRRSFLSAGLAALAAPAIVGRAGSTESAPPGSPFQLSWFDLPGMPAPRSLVPARDGAIWVCGSGKVGRLDSGSGTFTVSDLGKGAAPQDVVQAPDDSIWVLDSGTDALLRLPPGKAAPERIAVPVDGGGAGLASAVFDREGRLWFTAGKGLVGRFDPRDGKVTLTDAPRGAGPDGITATPEGELWFVSAAGNYIARIDPVTAAITVVEPAGSEQDAHQIASDSDARLWIGESRAGGIAAYDSLSGSWKQWKLPGNAPRPHAIHVDEADKVWVSDLAANAIIHFDPVTGDFNSLPSNRPEARVQRLRGRSGECWGAESGTGRLIRIQTIRRA
jgi:virginiamycin B lyase